MLLPFILLAQLSAPTEPVYSSEAVRRLVAAAAVANHSPPPALRSYTATVESEFSILVRDTLGRERAAQIEQVASSVKWRPGSEYAMHVVGYRSQTLGPAISLRSFLAGWTEPSLYGERIPLGAQFVTDSATGPRRPRQQTGNQVIGVHPFASDRERFYRFSGGDTVTILRSAGRAIPIVRLIVIPHLVASTRFAAFSGEVDVDVTRAQIVRMRGQFMVFGKKISGKSVVDRIPGLVAVAYAEFVNVEVDQRYWLPASQRTEFQTTMALLGRDRAVMRIVSRFNDYNVDDTSAAVSVADGRTHVPHTTTWAASDSISHFDGWSSTLGDATTSVKAADFDDMGPDVWKSTGARRIELAPTNWDNIVRYNRVEGLFTGAEVNVRMRNSFPGLTLGTTAGWAWSEQTIKGAAHASLARGRDSYGLGLERSLPSTNDFIIPGESRTDGINGLIASFDDFDYVDRRTALATYSRFVGSVDRSLVTVQAGAGSDRAEITRLESGVIGGGKFRPNRGLDAGSYAIGVLDAEFHPSASAEFVQPGFGARLHLEAGSGDLNWQRAELGLSGREYWGPVTVSLHFDGGAVFGKRIPPQTLFELGGSSILPGYGYKEFAGDRAMLFRSYGSYTLPVWRAPQRVWRTIYIPGLAPGFGAGIQGGWTGISTDSARASIDRLGASGDGSPLSVATGRVRSTFGFGMTLFSGTFHLGVARPIESGARWKIEAGFGPSF